MGLTIHYKIQFSGKKDNKGIIKDKVCEMQKIALHLKSLKVFDDVGEIRYFSENETSEEKKQEAIWLSTSFPKNMVVDRNHNGKEVYGKLYINVTPSESWYFDINPGAGSEWMRVGLSIFSSEVKLTNPIKKHQRLSYDHDHIVIRTGLEKYPQLKGFCKTQYASQYGGFHFARIHIGICTFLEEISKLKNIKINVDDEGKYWEKRDPVELINEVGSWNRFIAAFTYQLEEGLKNSGIDAASLEAPIKEFANYEVLEYEGLQEFKKLTGKPLIDIIPEVQKQTEKVADAYFNMKINNFMDLTIWLPYIFGNDISIDISDEDTNLIQKFIEEGHNPDDKIPEEIEKVINRIRI